MLEIFFGKFIQNQLSSLFMLALKTKQNKKATQKFFRVCSDQTFSAQ